MEKREFEKLQSVNFDQLLHDLKAFWRVRYHGSDFLFNVSCLYLVYLIKQIGSQDKMQESIKQGSLTDESKRHLLEMSLNLDFAQLEKLAEKYTEEEIKAAVLFTEPDGFRDSDVFSTPGGISKLALELLDLQDGDTLLDLGSGTNSFLIDASFHKKGLNKIGIEINHNAFIIGDIRQSLTGLSIKNKKGNIISQSFLDFDADKVFSHPPFATRWSGLAGQIESNKELKKYFENTKMTISGDWAFILSTLTNRKKSGRSVVIITKAGTWNKSDENIRRALLDEGVVEGVIELPGNIYANTSISTIMLVLSQNNKEVKMVDASGFFTKGRRRNSIEDKNIKEILEAYKTPSEISKVVPIDEIKEQESVLNPDRYIWEEIKISDAVKLGEVSLAINRGSMIRSSELDEMVTSKKTNNQYLTLQNIQDGIIDYDLPYLAELDDSLKKYCIKNNNIIISKISPFKVALAKVPEDLNLLANGNLYFIEVDETKMNPLFLASFLQGELGTVQLNKYAKGMAIKSISIKDLREVRVPKLSLEEQNKIAEEIELYDEQLEILEKQISIVKDKRTKVIQEVV